MDNDYISRREHNEFTKRMEDEHKRLSHRIEECEKSTQDIRDLVKNVGIMASNMEHLAKAQEDQNDRLERLEKLPNQNWNTIKNGIFNAIGVAIGGAIIAALLFFM